MTETNKTLNTRIRRDVGKSLVDLEVSAILELYELYTEKEIPPFRFHAGTNGINRNIIWRGKEYFATAIEVEGFETNILGRMPRPKVTVSNKDFIMSSILRNNSDFRQSKLVRVKIFLKHLDNVNFDEQTNPFGTPDPLSYISMEKYLISQKIIENKEIVQFELITPFDLQSLETANRTINGKYCQWQYRGLGCNYRGDLICKDNDESFQVSPKSIKNLNGSFRDILDSSGAILKEFYNEREGLKYYEWKVGKSYERGDVAVVFNIDLNGLRDPSHLWFVCVRDHSSSELNYPTKAPSFWEKDGCSKSIQSCKKRFLSSPNVSNDFLVMNGVLPFGGFPGTDKFKYE